MTSSSTLSRHNPPDFTVFFRQRLRRLYLRILVLNSIAIYIAETLLMLVVDHPSLMPHRLFEFLNGLLLIVILLPFNYFFIVRPFRADIEEHLATMHKLAQSSEVLERLFSITDTCIAYMDASFNFIRVNQAYAQASQRSPQDFIGKNHFELFPSAENQAIFESVVKSGQAVNIEEKPFEFPEHPEWGISYWNWSLQPVVNIAGQVEGLLLSLVDVSEEVRSKDQMRQFALFPVFNPNAVLRVSALGRIETHNPSAERMGLLTGQLLAEVIPGMAQLDLARIIEGGERLAFQAPLGQTTLLWTIQGAPDLRLAFLYSTDITRDKQSQDILRTRLRLMQYANTHTQDELLQFILDEIEALTASKIGFFHFLEPDQQTLHLQSWSTNTLQHMCSAAGKYSHYDLAQAGVWTDCVRQRQPVVQNDYASLPNRRGMPPGHALVQRELTVPVMREERVVAIMGVGNKPTDYTPSDVELASTMADFAWDVIERKKAETARQENEKQIERLYQAEKSARQLAQTLSEASQALSGSLKSDVVYETLLDHLARLVPYTSAHIVIYDDRDHLVVRTARGEEDWPPAERMQGMGFDLDDQSFVRPLLEQRQVLHLEDTFITKDASFFKQHPAVRSWLGIPLLAGEQVIGICGLEHTRAGFFTHEHIQSAAMLTSHAASAIYNAWLYEQVQQNRQRLQALSRRLVEVQEMERHHIARELHDEAGQALASVMVGLRMIERDRNDPLAVAARAQEVMQIADNVLENLHRLSVDLRPAALDHLGLVAAVRQHAEMVSDQHQLPVQFAALGKIERLPGEVETAVYRIVQEALTNIVRHAQATRVDVLLERRGTSLVVMVEDNGIGMPAQQPSEDHLGMVGMRERAEMLGGTLVVESAPGAGSTVFLELPCQFES